MHAPRPSAPKRSPKPAPAPAQALPTPPETLTPWRTIAALVDVLNEGADVRSFTRHGVRHYLYMAERGAAADLLPFVRRIGRKILISEPGFLYWLATRPTIRQ